MKTKFKETNNERNPTNSLNVVFKSIANIEYFDGSLVAGHNSQGKKEQEQAANPMPTRSSQVQVSNPPHHTHHVVDADASPTETSQSADGVPRPVISTVPTAAGSS